MGIVINDLLVREYAPQILTGYGNDDYSARKILPPIKVKSRETQIAAFTADHLRLVESLNGGTTPAAEVNDGMSYTSLDTKFHALKRTLTQRQIEEFPSAVSAVQYAYGIITQALQVEEDYNLYTAMVNSSNYTASNRATPSTKWNVSGGDPVSDFNTARAVVKGNCGKDPNCLAVSWKTHLTLADYARDSLGGNASYRMPTESDLAAFYGFQKYIVLGASYNNTVAGQTDDLTDIWGDDNAFLFYSPSSPSAMEPAFGYTVFVGNAMSQLTEKGNDPQPWTKFIANMEYQSKALSYGAAYWWYTVLS